MYRFGRDLLNKKIVLKKLRVCHLIEEGHSFDLVFGTENISMSKDQYDV